MIRQLMKRPHHERDMAWLRAALQSAIKLELSTVPPYLAALWSIKNDLDPVAKSIREVVQEEMLHMSFMCNMLSAIGEVPKINVGVPSYPGHLPGGVKPELTVSLAGLTNEALDVFLAIEQPEADTGALVDTGDTFTTIGDFYDAIEAVFEKFNPPFTTHNQITGPRTGMVIETMEDVRKAIKIIKHQGEGSRRSPIDTGPDDLSHYYRFAEIRRGQKLVLDPVSGTWEFEGGAVAFPDVWPMAVVPRGGYASDKVTPDVAHLLRKFDLTFTTLLDLLEAAWTNGDQASFWRALETMFKLQDYARPLMQIPIPGGMGTYGPCFRYLGQQSAEASVPPPKPVQTDVPAAVYPDGYKRWHVVQTVELGASAQTVWDIVGGFYILHTWHPDIELTETPPEQTASPAIRRVLTFPGQPKTVEELVSMDNENFHYRYKWHAGAWGEAVKDYVADIRVFDLGAGDAGAPTGKRCIMQWSSTFTYTEDALSTFYWNGFRALQKRFPLT